VVVFKPGAPPCYEERPPAHAVKSRQTPEWTRAYVLGVTETSVPVPGSVIAISKVPARVAVGGLNARSSGQPKRAVIAALCRAPLRHKRPHVVVRMWRVDVTSAQRVKPRMGMSFLNQSHVPKEVSHNEVMEAAQIKQAAKTMPTRGGGGNVQRQCSMCCARGAARKGRRHTGRRENRSLNGRGRRRQERYTYETEYYRRGVK